MNGKEILALIKNGAYVLKRNRFIFYLETERGSRRYELNQWAANGLWRNKQIERAGDHWVATKDPDPLDQQSQPTFKRYDND